MEPPSLLISRANPFPSRFITRTIFFCNAPESHECACCLLSFLYFHWFFPLSARETFSGNRFIYKSTRERVESKGLYGRCRLHLMGSWINKILHGRSWKYLSRVSEANKREILTALEDQIRLPARPDNIQLSPEGEVNSGEYKPRRKRR